VSRAQSRSVGAQGRLGLSVAIACEYGDSTTFVAVRAEEPDDPILPRPSYRDKWRRRW